MKLIKPQEELKYYTQRNNWWNPSGSCFPTTVAMAIRNNGIEKHPYGNLLQGMLIDDVIATLCNTIGKNKADQLGIRGSKLNIYWDIEAHIARYILNGLTIQNTLNANNCVRWKNATLSQIYNEIEAGYGVVLTIGMRKTGVRTGSHIIFAVGYDNQGLFFMDPYGNWTTHYKDTNGFMVHYPYEELKKWCDVNNSDPSTINQTTFRAMFIHSDLKPI